MAKDIKENEFNENVKRLNSLDKDIKDNEFNADLKRINSMDKSIEDAKPRSSSFKDANNFVRTKSGTFVIN